MATPNLSEIVTTTLRNRTKKLADNMSRNNAILYKMQESGTYKPVSGGRTIVQELNWANNQTYVRYSGYETLNISPSEVFSAAEFDYKQAAVAISISGLEMLQNSGENAVIDLLASRISNAESTMENGIAYDLYSDGTSDGGKQIGGLQLLVADDPTTGTVGGINRATAAFAFWRNIRYRAVTDGGAAISSANIQRYMNRLYNQLVRRTDKPNLILADNNTYNAYLESLQAQQRITSAKMADAGFTSLQYMGADVVLDGGFQGSSGDPGSMGTGGAPSTHMYFLNDNTPTANKIAA